MTYESDPTRWTQSPREAPDSLRAVFDAGRREGPSDAQMRTLALKLAALGSGAAVAATASAAHASAAAGGGAVAGGGMLSLTKVAVSIALIGAAATGTALLRRNEAPTIESRPAMHTEIAHAPIDAAPEQEIAPAALPRAERMAPTPSPSAPVTRPTPAEPVVSALPAARASTPATEHAAPRASDEDKSGDGPARERSHRHDTRATSTRAISTMSVTRARTARSHPQTRASEAQVADPSGADAPQAGEIDLLRRARAALAARPREAFKLTEQHRSEFPTGVFTQERDALAVEASLRSGELERARELAEAFVRRYPSSPHAHRFRETMNLQ